MSWVLTLASAHGHEVVRKFFSVILVLENRGDEHTLAKIVSTVFLKDNKEPFRCGDNLKTINVFEGRLNRVGLIAVECSIIDLLAFGYRGGTVVSRVLGV